MYGRETKTEFGVGKRVYDVYVLHLSPKCHVSLSNRLAPVG